MSAVGLLYVGVVLFVNGIMLLGHVSPRGAAPLNLFVGALQVFTPTYLIVVADGDPARIALAAGLYFFGFTYLWVGMNGLTGAPAEGLGWFSLTVAVAAVGFAIHSWVAVEDRTFAVIWLLWAILWFTFFLLMALHKEHLTPAIGVLAAGEGVLTAGVPAFLIITGWWDDTALTTIVVAVLGLLLLLACMPLSRLLSAPAIAAQPGTAPGVH
ncbi:AmiS/UreI family transporter [Blastococcus sp. BMG 814]|uniref:AmiS/UreI family transporter n=1 Tax=Blastococcus carthaginiensis TaxID=3050034 RepID=A0ABT9IJD1_9ACTN|nr:AmiS/UreI family transporter [Blastococcus carthaginiensis]MDP5185352.1 AmiS/UreI family transporter [Blastococcus carthaginiensis]